MSKQNDVEIVQEKAVFDIFCSYKLKKIMYSPDISYECYKSVIIALEILGFENYSIEYKEEMYDVVKHRIPEVKKIKTNELKFINCFLTEIKSESLKELFVKRIDSLIKIF